MLIKLHGKFAEDYGPEHRIEASSVAEAIAGLTRQVGFYADKPLDERPVVRVVGYDTVENLFEEREPKEVHLVPAMIGGGAFTKILVGAAIIALAIIAPFSLPITTAIVSFGASIVLSGVMQLFMKAPNVSKDSADPEASKYMGIGDNTVAIGTPIPLQWGRGPATGHLLAVNVDSSDLVMGQFPAEPT